jgi:hypothetical protein
MTVRTQPVKDGETTALRGSVADLLEVAAKAGFLNPTLPGEVAATVSGPAAAPVATAPEGPKMVLRTAYTRPSGEPFFARKIQFGDRETTDIQMIRDGVAAGLHLFLVGAPGCGKTAAIEAALWDWSGSHGIETVMGTSSTEAGDFVGGYVPQPDGTFKWVDGPLVRAMEGGKILYVDEIALIDPKVLSVVYPVMDGRNEIHIHENPTRGTIRAAEGFAVIASTNPNVPGAVMSEALLSRFAPPIEYTTDFSVAVKALDVPVEAAALARDLTKAVKSGIAYWAPTMRDLLQFRRISGVFGARAAWQGLLTAAPIEARPEVATKITEATGFKMTEGWEV